MEDHRRSITAASLAVWLFAVAGAVQAQPLDQRIPGLFGGTLSTTIRPGVFEGQPLQFSRQFNALSAELSVARSQAPIPSASGAFGFTWDNELDTFVRSIQSLGPGLAERAQTLGRHTITLSTSYTHIDFSTLEGHALSNLTFVQSALSKTLADQLPPGDARFKDDLLHTQLNLGLSYDLLFLTAAYGVTDSIDVSLALSINRAQMHAAAVTTIQNPDGSPGDTVFLTDSMGNLEAPSGHLCNGSLQCATDGFSASAVGTGDLFLRSKWHFADTDVADLALAGVLTLPTGNADNFLGFHDPTFTPWLIASKTLGRVSPHLNLGYSFRSNADVSQAEWIAGADLRTFDWLTLAGDFLGFHGHQNGVNDDVIQSAVGFKLNPFGQFVLAGTFQFPLNRDGLRADVIYTGQVEYTF